MTNYITFRLHNPNQKKNDRNQQIIEDRKKGLSYQKLRDKYGISAQRCYEIVKMYSDIYKKEGDK